MILSGDIGGTKVHLALFEDGDVKRVVAQKIFSAKEFADFSILLTEFLRPLSGIKIDRACFGIAGPILNERCSTTNLPWVIDAELLRQQIQTSHVFLINDLEANAWGLRCLGDDAFFVLNEGVKMEGNAALISPGTGLGEAGLYWNGKSHFPFSSEGGHSGFASQNEEEIELWRYLKKTHEHVSFEHVLSGSGIYQIYRFFVDVKGLEGILTQKILEEQKEPQRLIRDKAIKKECPVCMRTIDLFVSILGGEAGNLALKMLSVGGVYVGGGIPPKIVDFLKTGTFMKSFVDKGRFRSLMEKIPVKVVLNDNTALMGAMLYAQQKF